MLDSLQSLKDRVRKSLEALSAAARGRELEILKPQWRCADGSVEPLTRQERELVIRWKFLSTCMEAIDAVGMNATMGAHAEFAEAYLRADDEIGPVLILPKPEKIEVIFGEGAERTLRPTEQAAVDKFMVAFEAYRQRINRPY